MSKINVIDLFCGCGGLSLGLENTGFNVSAGIDNWDRSNKVYEKNFNHPIHDIDISQIEKVVNVIKGYKYDMIVGGPPCQDFSHAGKRDEDGARGNLTISFSEIIKMTLPTIFIMENVDRIVKTDKYSKIMDLFKSLGYGLTTKVLNASNCGVPQNRKRCFIIGILGEKDDFLNQIIENNLNLTKMTVRDYLSNTFELNHYYRHPRNYNRRGIFSIDEPSPTIRGVNRPIPKDYKIHSNDASQDLTRVRPLTSKERSLIQTFPPEFSFIGTKTDLEQMIGNAVPVKLAEFIGNCLMEYLKHKRFGDKITSTQKKAVREIA